MIAAKEARSMAEKATKEEPHIIVLEYARDLIERSARNGHYQTNLCLSGFFMGSNGKSVMATDECKEKAIRFLTELGYTVQVSGDNALVSW